MFRGLAPDEDQSLDPLGLATLVNSSPGDLPLAPGLWGHLRVCEHTNFSK